MATIHKTGIVTATPSSVGASTILLDENYNNLVDESGNVLIDNTMDEYGYSHGFIEGGETVSFYESGISLANSYVEW